GEGPRVGKFALNAVVAISVAITATFSALCHVKDENISEKMQHVQAQSVDAWAYYQAKGTKMNVAEAALDTMNLQRDLTPGRSAGACCSSPGRSRASAWWSAWPGSRASACTSPSSPAPCAEPAGNYSRSMKRWRPRWMTSVARSPFARRAASALKRASVIGLP